MTATTTTLSMKKKNPNNRQTSISYETSYHEKKRKDNLYPIRASRDYHWCIAKG